MNKEQQDLNWKCLPKETREELRQTHFHFSNTPNKTLVHELESLFGLHNLTSDKEPLVQGAPKFGVGDKVKVISGDHLGETAMITKVIYDGFCKLSNIDGFFSPIRLEPHTDPETKDNMEENKTYYKSENWLNGFESPSTGSIVCYDGWRNYSDGADRCTFIEVADCHQKVRLHKAQGDTIKDFINKAIKMRNVLNDFINHLITK